MSEAASRNESLLEDLHRGQSETVHQQLEELDAWQQRAMQAEAALSLAAHAADASPDMEELREEQPEAAARTQPEQQQQHEEQQPPPEPAALFFNGGRAAPTEPASAAFFNGQQPTPESAAAPESTAAPVAAIRRITARRPLGQEERRAHKAAEPPGKAGGGPPSIPKKKSAKGGPPAVPKKKAGGSGVPPAVPKKKSKPILSEPAAASSPSSAVPNGSAEQELREITAKLREVEESNARLLSQEARWMREVGDAAAQVSAVVRSNDGLSKLAKGLEMERAEAAAGVEAVQHQLVEWQELAHRAETALPSSAGRAEQSGVLPLLKKVDRILSLNSELQEQCDMQQSRTSDLEESQNVQSQYIAELEAETAKWVSFVGRLLPEHFDGPGATASPGIAASLAKQLQELTDSNARLLSQEARWMREVGDAAAQVSAVVRSNDGLSKLAKGLEMERAEAAAGVEAVQHQLVEWQELAHRAETALPSSAGRAPQNQAVEQQLAEWQQLAHHAESEVDQWVALEPTLAGSLCNSRRHDMTAPDRVGTEERSSAALGEAFAGESREMSSPERLEAKHCEALAALREVRPCLCLVFPLRS